MIIVAGIPLNELNNAIAYKSVPWAKDQISIKRASFPKGKVPEHLRGYTDDLARAARACARETEGLRGSDRVRAMNACVSNRLGGRGRGQRQLPRVAE